MSLFQEDILATASTSEEAGWTSSSKFLAFQPREWERFWRVQHKRRRKGSILAESPFIPVNMKDWIEYRLGIIQEDIEATKTRIQACEHALSYDVLSVPAFGGKGGMLRSAALNHHHSRFHRNLFLPMKPELGLLWTEADQIRAEELLGIAFMSIL